MDRIDLHVEVTPVTYSDLAATQSGESSKFIRSRVVRARQIQEKRFKDHSSKKGNASIQGRSMQEHCRLNEAGAKLLQTAMERLNLSARAYDRIRKVARTIADLDEKESIETAHVAEAIQYRSLDRENWSR